MKRSSKLSTPNLIAGSRRNFLIKGGLTTAAALTGMPAMLFSMNSEARAEGEPIPVGQCGPTTDFAAPDGIEFKNGLTLACEEINALGGILGRPLEPSFEDTAQMGDATNAHDDMAVILEGVQAAVVSTSKGQVHARTYRTVVSDGQLSVRLVDLGGADANAVINGLSIAPAP